jgi:NAD(P)H-hydrate repair Nnr-like enzyme with NAD(P)H-hydrate dehydratase domain
LGGLAVQTGNLELTAQAGVVIHAASGDSAALDGERGLLAGDVIGNIRSWMNPPYNSHK